MKENCEKVGLIPADKENKVHKKAIWTIKNENLNVNFIANNFISYEDHSKWWENVFDKEYIYLVLYEYDFCGYIRLTKRETEFKEKNEISIALAKKYQNLGIGTYAYKFFEEELKKKGITNIIAKTKKKNLIGQKFFETNGFIKESIKENYVRFIKNLVR